MMDKRVSGAGAARLPLAMAGAALAGAAARAQGAAQESGTSVSGGGAAAAWLPEAWFSVRWLELSLGQWIGLLVVVFVAYLASWIATAVLHRVARALVKRTESPIDDLALEICLKPTRLLLTLAFFAGGVLLLRLPAEAYGYLVPLERALILLAVTWLLFRMADGLHYQLREQLTAQGRNGAAAMLPLGVRTVKVAVMVVALLGLLQNFGFKVGAVLGALGVGGIAVALAAQKTLEHVFGGAMIVADQPVRVGDLCRFGDKIGTVEDIGLRSTKIRTLDRTVISVPNAEFASMQIENFTRRDRIRLQCVLGLRYETTPDQMRYVLVGLRRLLVAHPKVAPDPLRARFVGFGAYSLDVEVSAYVLTTDWNEFLAIREDILLRMMDVVEEAGTGFAFPSQTNYFARDTGFDPERVRAAEQRVAEWRRANELPFPDFAPETLAALDDTLDYPPAGSAWRPERESAANGDRPQRRS